MDVEAFFSAIQNGNLRLVEQMLQAHPDLIHTQDDRGLSPILVATYQRHPDIVELLISHKVLLDIFEAAATGRVNHVVRILARKPELATAYSLDGYQPLALAAFFGHLEVMQFLLRAGVEVNALSRNPLQAAPIHSAAAGGQVEAMRLLLEYGADPNACQAGKVAPLHLAAQQGNLQMILLLLLSGADLQQKTATGKTALDLAREANHPEVVELLKTEITKRFRSTRRITAPR